MPVPKRKAANAKRNRIPRLPEGEGERRSQAPAQKEAPSVNDWLQRDESAYLELERELRDWDRLSDEALLEFENERDKSDKHQ